MIAKNSGLVLDTRDLSTAMVSHGVWEEISKNFPSILVKDNDDDA